jgi:hypothetical protein
MGDDLLTAQELCGDAEDSVNELSLADRIAFRDPADLAFSDCVHCLVPINRSACALGRTEAEARRDPLLDESMVLFNGLITNDKFCLSRISRQKLRYARRPRVSACIVDGGCEHLRDERHRGGANEAAVETSASVSTDHGCEAAVGSGLPASPGVECPAQLGFGPVALGSPSAKSGGEE